MSTLSSRARLCPYVIAAIFLTIAADALFFGRLREPVGLSAPLLAALLAVAIFMTKRHIAPRILTAWMLLLGLGFLALLENVDARSLFVMVAALAVFALAAAQQLSPLRRTPALLGRFFLSTPLALPNDFRAYRRAHMRARHRGYQPRLRSRAILVWLMPILLAVGFVLLLAAGNPILGRWLDLIDLSRLVNLLAPTRLLFWTLVIGATWPFLRPRIRRHGLVPHAPDTLVSVPPRDPSLPEPSTQWSQSVFGEAAILRALILFNAVFFLQTTLDIAYLWGGAELPDGIGYAAYAHRGAYTLVATALLAALFVLVALRPGANAAADRRIRALVYLWIGQNVVLVLSSMLRLDLYVDVYALTHWRLAAFVWMGVVAAGLVLICLQIAGGRSNHWLVNANLAVLFLVTAGSCFVDDRALVADFNVAHSREVSGEGVSLDVDHLVSLGPAAIPAIDRLIAHAEALPVARDHSVRILATDLRWSRRLLAERHLAADGDWRGWTFRNWRLSRYLDGRAFAPVPPAPMGPFLPPLAGSN